MNHKAIEEARRKVAETARCLEEAAGNARLAADACDSAVERESESPYSYAAPAGLFEHEEQALKALAACTEAAKKAREELDELVGAGNARGRWKFGSPIADEEDYAARMLAYDPDDGTPRSDELKYEDWDRLGINQDLKF